MVKQRFEKYVSKELSKYSENIWYQKNMVMPLAHKQSVGDFIILTKHFNLILECKECKNLDGKGVFNVDRLTQLNDLKLFQSKLYRNVSVVAILFWGGNFKKSNLYFIPVHKYLEKMEHWNKKSFNAGDMQIVFGLWKVNEFSDFINGYIKND